MIKKQKVQRIRINAWVNKEKKIVKIFFSESQKNLKKKIEGRPGSTKPDAHFRD